MILSTVVVAVFLGIVAQVVAERSKLPAILPLLVLGVAAGPHVLGVVHPESLGEGLEVFVHLGVAIILFEGGLSLNPRQLRRVGGAVRALLSLGTAVTAVGGAALARLATGMPWPTAALFGAIVTVTGPTVVGPLLRHMIAPRRVKTLLVSEGLIIDPVGAVLAYLVLQWIARVRVPLAVLSRELLVLVATGAVLGFVAGSLGRFLARSRTTGADLRNPAILALVLLCFAVSEHAAPQSGILAVVVMGFTISASEIPDLEPLRAFKGQLTILLISTLFILLAGQLDLGAMAHLGLGGVAVAVGLILVVRPLAVYLSIWPRHLDAKERAVVALTAPRGIVAAAVASLAARELTRAGIAGGAALEGLVYLVILVTGGWATLMAVVLPRAFGYARDPARRLTVLVGANPLSRALAEILRAEGRSVTVVDAVTRKLDGLRQAGIGTVRGDARDAATYERAGVQRDTHLLALTTNDELNLLASELVRTEFGVEHPVVALQAPPEEFGRRRRAWMDLLGGRAIDVPSWMRALESKEALFLTLDERLEDVAGEVEDQLAEHPDQLVFVCGWEGHQPGYRRDEGDGLRRFERVTLLVASGEVAERLVPLAQRTAAEPGAIREREPAPVPGA